MSKQDIEKRLGFAAQGVKETTRTSAKASMAKPPRKYDHGDRVYIMDGNKRVGSGVIDYMFDYDDFVGTYIYKVRQEDGGRASYNETSLKKMSRPGAKAEMGFLSRVGYAATALTADPADPKSPEYRKQVSEAKAAAKDAITNYKFMRDKVKERLAALDAYVTNAIKVINSATSAKDIEHYVEQLRIAVKSQSMILGASKSPFSRAGAKAKFGLSPSEMKENQRRIETNIRYEAGVIRDVSSNMRFIKDEIQRLTAEIKNTRDIKRKAQLSLKLDAENKKMKDQVAYLRRARQMIQENQADAKSLGITLDAKWAGNFARPGVKAKMSATFIVAEAIFNAENAVRRGDNENARRWIKAAQDAMDETVVSTGMRSKLEQLVKRYKMSRPGVKAKA